MDTGPEARSHLPILSTRAVRKISNPLPPLPSPPNVSLPPLAASAASPSPAMRSLFSRHARHPATPPPPSFSGGGETPPRRRIPKENVDPSYSSPAHNHHHSTLDHGVSPFRSPSSATKPLSARNRLPPRPPSSNPLKRKLDVSSAAGPAHDAAPGPDSGVQVRLGFRGRFQAFRVGLGLWIWPDCCWLCRFFCSGSRWW